MNHSAAFSRWRMDRSSALNRVAAEMLRSDPDLMATAAATLRRWRAPGPSHPDPYWDEWEQIMARGVDAVIAQLLEESEHAAEMRKCGPFSCLVPDEERLAVMAAWEPRRPGPERK